MRTLGLLILIFPLFSFANVPAIPTGQFDYAETTAQSTRHQVILNLRSSTDKQNLENYRASGYQCSRKPNSFALCKKRIETNPNKIIFKTAELEKLSLEFSVFFSLGLATESEYVNQYSVQQNVFLGSFLVEDYKIYQDNRNGELRLDFQNKNLKSKKRFTYKPGDAIYHRSIQKENLNKKEVLIHSLISTYNQNL